MADLNKITDFIASCYQDSKFPNDLFMFYENRRDYKDKYRTGVIKYRKNKFFFKILPHDFSVSEKKILKNLIPKFKIISNIFVKNYGEYFIHVYPYVNTHRIDGYAYLRDNKISFGKKKIVLKNYFNTLKKQIKNTHRIKKGAILCESNKLFFSRLNQNAGRCVQYYGKRWKYLLNDVTQNFPYFYPQIKVLLQLIQKEIKNKHSTIFAYTHGDLHDFNFSYDGLFWDLDTFNINPITNDFAIYYWHFFAREDFLILKYNPWLSRYMHNYLEDDELSKVRILKKELIRKYYLLLVQLFKQNGLLDYFKNELILKIFCRCFLVDNVLYFSLEDRKIIYNYWVNFVSFYNNKDIFNKALFPQGKLSLNNIVDFSCNIE